MQFLRIWVNRDFEVNNKCLWNTSLFNINFSIRADYFLGFEPGLPRFNLATTTQPPCQRVHLSESAKVGTWRVAIEGTGLPRRAWRCSTCHQSSSSSRATRTWPRTSWSLPARNLQSQVKERSARTTSGKVQLPTLQRYDYRAYSSRTHSHYVWLVHKHWKRYNDIVAMW